MPTRDALARSGAPIAERGRSTRRRLLVVAGSILALCLERRPPLALSAFSGQTSAVAAERAIVSALTDEEFWRIATEFSERAGAFQSDNLLSNERGLQQVIPELRRTTARDGVYVGVGPEQNFTYIAALRPKMAFVIDIRRGNFDLHLMYKALFELSADRGEFVSRLFSRKRPNGLTSSSTASDIFDAFGRVEPSDSLYSQNLRAIVALLTKKHGYVLSSADLLRLQHIYTAIYTYGPAIQYSTTQNAGRWRSSEPTYVDLMVATDGAGEAHGFLASEDAFAFVRTLERDNLLVPVIGNFAGARAIRSIGNYLKSKGAAVSVFYVSNVEEYLRRDGLWDDFCTNITTLPLADTATFVRAVRDGAPGAPYGLVSELGSIATDVKNCDSNAQDLNERTNR